MAELDPQVVAVVPAEQNEPEPDRTELTAQEALERIQRGQTVQNVCVRRLKLRGEFAQPVRFKHCTLIQPVFDGATFKAECSFVGCTLDRPTFSRGNVFNQGLNLGGCTLNKALIRQLTVKGPLGLENASARGKLFFGGCDFDGPVRLWEFNAHCWLEFKDCTFHQDVDMRSMHVDQGLSLRKCKFVGPVLLRGTTVCKKLEAAGSRFENLLDLGKCKLHDFVYLEGIEQGDKQQFAFLNALADRILVQPEQLVGRLANESTGRYEEAMQEYGLLKRCYETLHRYDQEDWAFYRFKVNQRRCCTRSWWRPWTKLAEFGNWLFLDLGCGYGTNPFRAVRAAGAIILLFALIYAVFIGEFYVEKRPFPDLEVTDLPNRALIGLLTSVSVFTSGFGGIRDLAKGWMNVPLIVESLLGTLLWGLFIVAFSRKVIR